jgi:hypothetical protein
MIWGMMLALLPLDGKRTRLLADAGGLGVIADGTDSAAAQTVHSVEAVLQYFCRRPEMVVPGAGFE